MAWRISVSVGRGLASSSATAESTMPGVQKPHCVPPCSTSACLHRMQRARGHAFDGGDARAVGLRRQHQAGTHRRAVDQHGARAAVAVAAAFLGAGEPQPLAQQPEQRIAPVGQRLARLAVHLERDDGLHDRCHPEILRGAIGERPAREHGDELAPVIGRAARIGDRPAFSGGLAPAAAKSFAVGVSPIRGARPFSATHRHRRRPKPARQRPSRCVRHRRASRRRRCPQWRCPSPAGA